MKRLLKHRLIIGGVALVVAASAGGAYAATQSGSTSRQAFVNDVARRLNVSPSQLRSAVRGALLDRLNAAVKAGELSQSQADRIRQRIEQGGALPFGGHLWRHGFAPPGAAMASHSLLPVAAGYLGLSQAQVLSDLRSGKTLAQVAQAQNKSVSGLEQALVSAATARLDRMVAAKQITQAQEQRRLNRLSHRIDRLVNHVRVDHGPAGAADVAPPVPPGGPPPGSPSFGPPSAS